MVRQLFAQLTYFTSQYCTSRQLTHCVTTYPEDIGSFWDDGPVPFIKTPLKLLLHEYDVAGIMQPITHGLLQHNQEKHVSMCFTDCSTPLSIVLLDIGYRQKKLIKGYRDDMSCTRC